MFEKRDKKDPYRIYLTENEMPKAWYNLRADMKEKPEPLINPQTLKPVSIKELTPIFCDELAKQELDNENRFINIPDEVLEIYKQYRPSPLCRAYELEKALDIAQNIGDIQYILHAYTKLYDQVNTDSTMSGAKKRELLEKYQKEIDKLQEQLNGSSKANSTSKETKNGN